MSSTTNVRLKIVDDGPVTYRRIGGRVYKKGFEYVIADPKEALRLQQTGLFHVVAPRVVEAPKPVLKKEEARPALPQTPTPPRPAAKKVEPAIPEPEPAPVSKPEPPAPKASIVPRVPAPKRAYARRGSKKGK